MRETQNSNILLLIHNIITNSFYALHKTLFRMQGRQNENIFAQPQSSVSCLYIGLWYWSWVSVHLALIKYEMSVANATKSTLSADTRFDFKNCIVEGASPNPFILVLKSLYSIDSLFSIERTTSNVFVSDSWSENIISTLFEQTASPHSELRRFMWCWRGECITNGRKKNVWKAFHRKIVAEIVNRWSRCNRFISFKR